MLAKIGVIVFMCFITYASSQTYKQLMYSDCGSKNVQIKKLSLEPMPIIQPGTAKLTFSISTTEFIKGVIKADLNIIRKVSGIPLPVKCYIIDGHPVGSCSYPDLCSLMKRLTEARLDECPKQLEPHGINCNCPVNVVTRSLDVDDMEINIPAAPQAASWLSVGDFDVKLKASVGNIQACYDIKFSVKPLK